MLKSNIALLVMPLYIPLLTITASQTTILSKICGSHIPPTITQPLNGSVTTDRNITVQGNAQANTMLHVAVNGTERTALSLSAATYGVAVPLSIGSNTISVYTTNQCGNNSESASTIVVRQETLPAEPLITEPANDSIFSTSNIIVRGTAPEETLVQIYRNDQLVAETISDSAGAFAVSANLSKGENLFYSKAKNSMGESTPSNTVSVIYNEPVKTSPPLIKAPASGLSPATPPATPQSPPAQATTTTPATNITPTIAITETLPTTKPSLMLTVSGTAGATVEVYAVDGTVRVGSGILSANGSFTLLLSLKPGMNQFFARTTLWGQAQQSTVLNIERTAVRPGKAEIYSLKSGHTTSNPKLAVSGKASLAEYFEIFHNGQKIATLLPETGFEFSIMLLLTDGANTLSVDAVNEAGRTAGDEIKINLTTDASKAPAPLGVIIAVVSGILVMAAGGFFGGRWLIHRIISSRAGR